MTSQITRISYDGPFRQLSTAPANFSITVRDLCATTIQCMSNQDATDNTQTQQNEKRETNVK